MPRRVSAQLPREYARDVAGSTARRFEIQKLRPRAARENVIDCSRHFMPRGKDNFGAYTANVSQATLKNRDLSFEFEQLLAVRSVRRVTDIA